MSVKNKKEKNRLNSTNEYIDNLFKRYSKLNIVRVDLGYKKDVEDYDLDMVLEPLESANRDLKKMLNNRRSKPSIFKDNVGYIIKKEYTEDRGVHFHTTFIFDGQKVKDGATKAKQIGEYWSENITDKRGSYHNCHLNNYKDNGIGLIDYKNKEKIDNLKNGTLKYFCKDEQSIEPVKTKRKERAFIRSPLPKEKIKSGRPRKE